MQLLAKLGSDSRGKRPRQMPTSLADVSLALTALDERLTAGGERIALGRNVLSAIELFECVGDLSIGLHVEGESVISQEQPFRARITE